MAVLACLGTPALLLVSSGAALAQVAPTVIFSEDFQYAYPGRPLDPAQRISTYAPPSGVTFTADPPWLVTCNGFLAAWEQPVNSATATAECGAQAAWNSVQIMAQALGLVNNMALADAQKNYAVAANTAGNAQLVANMVETESSQIPLLGIPAGGIGRFITFSVDVAVRNCNSNHPLLDFNLLGPPPLGTEISLGTGVIDPCLTNSGTTLWRVEGRGLQPAQDVLAGRLTAPEAALYTSGSTVAIRLRNRQGSSAGNDHAFDNVRLLDATPTMTKSFSSPAWVGKPTQLTFTVTNTTDLLAKAGWSFTDTLVAGLKVASPNNLSTTCTGSTLSAVEGGSTITVSNGILSKDVASCTITVDVVADAPGSYANGPTQVTPSVGLNLPPPGATLVVLGLVRLTKISNLATGTFDFTASNTTQGSASITTTAAGGSGTEFLPPLQIAANGTEIVVNEAAQTGWALSGITCTKPSGGGSFAPVYDLANRRVTIPAADVNLGSSFACTYTNTSISADLRITKTNTPSSGADDLASDTLAIGANTTYQIVVHNDGPAAADGAIFRDPASARLNCTSVTCGSETNGAVCPSSPTVTNLQSAGGLVIPTLPAGSSATFSLTCAVQ